MDNNSPTVNNPLLGFFCSLLSVLSGMFCSILNNLDVVIRLSVGACSIIVGCFAMVHYYYGIKKTKRELQQPIKTETKTPS